MTRFKIEAPDTVILRHRCWVDELLLTCASNDDHVVLIKQNCSVCLSSFGCILASVLGRLELEISSIKHFHAIQNLGILYTFDRSLVA